MRVYDTAATFMQLGAKSTVMDIAAAAANFGTMGKDLVNKCYGICLESISNPEFVIEDNATFQKLANNPTAMAIITIGVRSDLGNSFFSHPNENGHVEIKNAVMAALENETTGKDVAVYELINAIQDLVAFVEEYYDEAYAYGYEKAVEYGIIDTINEYLAVAKDAIDDAAVWADENADAAHAAAIVAAAEAAKAVIEEVEVLVNGATALNDATYAQVKNVLAALANTTDELVDLIALAVADLEAAAIAKTELLIAELEAKIAELEAAAQAQIEAAEEKVAARLEYLYELLKTAPAEAVAEILAEIELVQNALADEIAAINAALNAAIEALVEFYAEEIAAANNAVDAAVAAILADLEAKIAAIEAQAAAQIAALEAAVAAEIAALEAAAAAKIAEFEAAVAAKIADLEAAAQAKLAELYAALENATEDAKAAILAEIEAVEAALEAAIAAEIAALEAKIAEIEAELEAAIAAAVAALEAKIAEIDAQVAEQIATLEAHIAEQIAALNAQIAALKEIALNVNAAILEVVENVKFIINTIEEYANALLSITYEDLVNAAVAVFNKYAPAVAEKVAAWFADNQDEVIDLLIACGEDIVDYLKDNADDILAFIGYVAKEYGEPVVAPIVEKLLEEALTFDYTVSGNSNILAIGGTYYVEDDEHYASVLAGLLGIDEQYNVLAQSGLRISDLIALLDADYDNDAYGDALLEKLGNIDELRAGYNAMIANSDLITIEFGVEDFTNFVIKQLFGKVLTDYNAELSEIVADLNMGFVLPEIEAYELDWARFGIADVDAAVALIKAKLVEQGVPEYYEIDLGNGELIGVAVADYITYAVECYAYAVANYVFNYAKAIETINAINPDAQIVVLGAINALAGVSFEFEGNVINVGEYAEYLVDVVDAQTFLCALALPNTTYVSMDGVENYVNATREEVSIMDFIALNFDLVGEDITVVPGISDEIFAPSAAGNALIAEKIFAAMTVTCGHAYDWCLDATCNICGEQREITGHVYDNECDAYCNICDALRYGVGHVYDDCYDAICNVCGEEREVTGHIFNNRCDATCNNCDYIRVVEGHKYDNACDAYCNTCGSERAVADHVYDNACDADCNECGETRTPAAHKYDNACDANCNVCGETRTPAAHKYDDCEDTECNVCGADRAALEHTYGEWVIVKEATTQAEGEKKRECTACGATETETIAKLTPAPIDPGKKPATEEKEEKKPLSGGAVAGIVAGSVVVAGAGAFAIYWFAVQKSTFAALGTAIKGVAGGVGAAFKKLGAKIANLFKKG